MSKIPYDMMDGVSATFYKVSDKVDPLLYKYGITPNAITLFRIVVGGLSIFLIKINSKLAALLLVMFFFLDCLEGHHAMKNNMVSTFRDYFNQIIDIIFVLGLIFTVYRYLNTTEIVVGGILLLTVLINIGCKERYIESISDPKIKATDKSIKLLKNLCPVNDGNVKMTINFIKSLSYGTFMVFLIQLILKLDFRKPVN